MKDRIALIAALLCAGLALVIAGCGGDDESSSSTSMTKDEFIAQADAICQAGKDALDAAGQQLGQNPTDEQLRQAITDTVIPTLEGEFDDIEALTPPAGDEDEVAAIIAAGRSGIDEAKDNPDRLFAAGQDSPFADANRLAQDYGLKVCGSGS
jgi:Flp pilus assembly protein TadD